jgi:hypothetical protein
MAMKKIFILLFAISTIFLVAVHAQATAKAELLPVKVFIPSHDAVYKLVDMGINIEELRDGYIETRLSLKKMEELRTNGWVVEMREIITPDFKIISEYHGYNWISALLDSIHNDHPSITQKISYGTSYDGYSLWAFLVTSNPNSASCKAEVRLAANIHGDELIGTEMLLGMIDSLTNYYGSVPEITDLVNTREIWFIPTLNPDGNLVGVRYNGHNEDLNRDFPVPDGGANNGYVSGIEPETQAFIDYWSTKRVVLSLNYHGGALVANYPWDYTLARCPDDPLAREVSLGYARLNTPMYTETYDYDGDGQADSGVVDGADWYIVRGSLQDWSYHATSGLDITIECSVNKSPPKNQLPTFWNDNRNSLLYFIRQSGWGVQGIVTDSLTGLPINWASVTPFGIDKPVYTDSIGDYHRMLMTGQYDLIYSAVGYHEKWSSDVSVKLDSVTNLDIQLSPILVSGTVFDSASGDPIPGAVVEITGVRRDTTDSAGNYMMRWNQDDYYSLKASATGYNTVIFDSLKFENDSTINFSLSNDSGVTGDPDVRIFATRLEQPYPNPAGTGVTIRFQLSFSSKAVVEIYDVTGRLIKSIDQGIVSRGIEKTCKWDGMDHYGKKVSAGIYFCRLTAGTACKTRRMTIIY